jgi:hypothetical protein
LHLHTCAYILCRILHEFLSQSCCCCCCCWKEATDSLNLLVLVFPIGLWASLNHPSQRVYVF